jgi:hypothetical protein
LVDVEIDAESFLEGAVLVQSVMVLDERAIADWQLLPIVDHLEVLLWPFALLLRSLPLATLLAFQHTQHLEPVHLVINVFHVIVEEINREIDLRLRNPRLQRIERRFLDRRIENELGITTDLHDVVLEEFECVPSLTLTLDLGLLDIQGCFRLVHRFLLRFLLIVLFVLLLFGFGFFDLVEDLEDEVQVVPCPIVVGIGLQVHEELILFLYEHKWT